MTGEIAVHLEKRGALNWAVGRHIEDVTQVGAIKTGLGAMSDTLRGWYGTLRGWCVTLRGGMVT